MYAGSQFEAWHHPQHRFPHLVYGDAFIELPFAHLRATGQRSAASLSAVTASQRCSGAPVGTASL